VVVWLLALVLEWSLSLLVVNWTDFVPPVREESMCLWRVEAICVENGVGVGLSF
jgi:hypothetical protein